MANFFAVGIGGFLGSCLRYIISKWVGNFTVTFPLGTLLSNVIAGFFIGFIIGLEQNSVKMTQEIKLFMTTGLLGGLSTFSTFSLETIELFRAKEYVLSIGNVASNLALSLCGVMLGLAVSKIIVCFFSPHL